MITRHLSRVPGLLLFLFVLHLPFVAQDVSWGAGEHCWLKAYDERVGCYERVLDDIIRHQGTRQALATLQQSVENDPVARIQSHPLAHQIGRLSYAHYNNMAQAFLRCTDAFNSGCYHGVLEAHLSGIPHLAPRDVAEVCRGVKDPLRPAFTQFLCLHGLGHGLVMHFNNDMFKALTFCDGLTTIWDQENCYGGVFMQNIVAFKSLGDAGHDSHGGHGGHAVTTEPRKLLDPNDHLYPCTVVGEKYRRACYLMQSSAMLALNGQNFAKTFTLCQKAPEQYLITCIQSVGRDISGVTLTNPEATKAICFLAPSHLVGECLKGAVKDFIGTHANPQRGIALCRVVDDANKEDCYKGVGTYLMDFYPDREKRNEACRSAEPGYQAACRGTKSWFSWLKLAWNRILSVFIALSSSVVSARAAH
jgi:hypothetical protein